MIPFAHNRADSLNCILRALAASDFALLKPDLEPVDLRFRLRLQEANRDIKHIYFPESGLASVVATSGGTHRQAEVAIVGNEGMTGMAAILDAVRSPCEVFMQVEGKGTRIEVGRLNTALDSSRSMRRTFARAVHVFQVQSSFNALANAQGKIEERLARWLLMAQDRNHGLVDLKITHEFLSLMLGVRRAGVTMAIHEMETRGLVSTRRKLITVVDREGLLILAHGLYGQPEAEFSRLFAPLAS